jgi:hypothetical protein
MLPRMRLPITLLFAAALTGAALAAPPPTAKPAGDDMDPQAKRITGSDKYVPTFGLRASISRGFKVHGVLAVDAGLDVPSDKSRKKVDALKPRIMSTMRDAVSNYASLAYMVGEKPDADILKIRLQKAVDAVVGPGEAKVTLASVIVFPE